MFHAMHAVHGAYYFKLLDDAFVGSVAPGEGLDGLRIRRRRRRRTRRRSNRR